MIMSLEQLNSIDDVRGFLEGTQAVIFGVTATKKERYRWVQKALVKHRYMLLNKAGKGLITRYLMKVTSYSHAQTKRLIRQYLNTGKVTVRLARGNGFKPTYTSADVRLLARMDELHGQPSGAVLKKLCERAHGNFNDIAHKRSSCRTYTTYGLLKPNSANGAHSPKRSLKKPLLASEGNLSPTTSPGIFVSIPSIKGTKINARVYTTSTP